MLIKKDEEPFFYKFLSIAKEITSIMLQHRHYEFAGTMEYSYIEDDNVLVVTGKQHRKG